MRIDGDDAIAVRHAVVPDIVAAPLFIRREIVCAAMQRNDDRVCPRRIIIKRQIDTAKLWRIVQFVPPGQPDHPVRPRGDRPFACQLGGLHQRGVKHLFREGFRQIAGGARGHHPCEHSANHASGSAVVRRWCLFHQRRRRCHRVPVIPKPVRVYRVPGRCPHRAAGFIRPLRPICNIE
ncbi:MAG: hypothetical protein BWY76_03495 [bacterium ADurb.Bin429]|nr:MAG: hypothetical protein BWY76_03495 [bacterium ADurb.Bin429]